MAAANRDVSTPSVIVYEEDNQPIRLVYDTWTPRPHFIAVQCLQKQEVTADELKATYAIIGHFLRANPDFDREAILSFHRGKWYQQYTQYWHAHLCVPKEPYLEKAKTQNIQSSNNKEWRGARTLVDGMNGWLARKKSEYAEYRNECVQKGIPNGTAVESLSLSTLDSSSNEFKLVWMSPAPRIGIIAQSPTTTTLASLYTFMSNVRVAAEKALGRLDRNFSNFGCHLCLYVRGQSGTIVTCRQDQVLTADETIRDSPNIVGYIQMDESQYVQWLPHDLRKLWLNAFASAEHFVQT